MKTDKTKKCLICGAKFKPYVTKQKYCSNKCRYQARTYKEVKPNGSLSNYISYCKMFGCIPYAEYQTKVLRKYGI